MLMTFLAALTWLRHVARFTLRSCSRDVTDLLTVHLRPATATATATYACEPPSDTTFDLTYACVSHATKINFVYTEP